MRVSLISSAIFVVYLPSTFSSYFLVSLYSGLRCPIRLQFQYVALIFGLRSLWFNDCFNAVLPLFSCSKPIQAILMSEPIPSYEFLRSISSHTSLNFNIFFPAEPLTTVTVPFQLSSIEDKRIKALRHRN